MLTPTKIGICCLGGTMESDETVEGEVDYVGFIRKHVRPVDVNVELIRICCCDSREVTNNDRQHLFTQIRSSALRKFLVLHGTFTLLETLLYLQERKDQLADKTVVGIGSFWTAINRNALATDATFNLGFAFGMVRVVGHGIYLAMHGGLWTPDQVHFDSTQNLFMPND